MLWPKPRVRPIRFHDLRHTAASLLMQAGVPVHVVQRMLRHRAPRLTANVYGHLAPDYLLREVAPQNWPGNTPRSESVFRSVFSSGFGSHFEP